MWHSYYHHLLSLLFINWITNMTMSGNIWEHSAVCPLVADETDAGMEAPATGLAPESGRRIDGVFGSSLSCPAFFFGGVGSLNFRVEGALVNHASPGWSVRCCVFPCGDVDVKVLEVSFQGVFEAFALSSYLPCPLTKLTVQQLLGYSGVWHSEDMTCPACLCLAHGGDDAGELCPLQHLSSSRNLTEHTVKYDSSANCSQWCSSIFTKYFDL